MHGRVKVRTTAEQEELKKIERAKKVVQYRAGMELILRKRKQGTWDDELFSVSELMVLKNPDIYTLWNVRREAFGAIEWSEEERVERLKKELTLTEHCLRANPKSYSVWHQRCWVNDNINEPDWDNELSLCNKCLNMDERNFHCWDYRRHVVRNAGVSQEEEFDYSTSKIESNFSNYSSWHYRSLILPKVFPDNAGELPIGEEKHAEELDLVMNATFTDPNDTSAWFYQRWLLAAGDSLSGSTTASKRRENLLGIKATEYRILIAFNRDVSLVKKNVELKIDGVIVDVDFVACNGSRFASMWIGGYSSTSINGDGETLRRKNTVELTHDGNGYPLVWRVGNSAWEYGTNLSSDSVEKSNVEQLRLQLDNYKQLAEIEPDNKWALLTGVFIMKKIDRNVYHETVMKDLATLVRIDKLRARYYNDLRSKYAVDHAIDEWRSRGDEELWNSPVDLSCLDLTSLSREQWFGFSDEIHLGGNRLGNSLRRINAFQSCVKLSLSSNGISSLSGFPALVTLRFLSLRNNELTDVDDVVNLMGKLRLEEVDLRDNPVAISSDLGRRLEDEFPELKVRLN